MRIVAAYIFTGLTVVDYDAMCHWKRITVFYIITVLKEQEQIIQTIILTSYFRWDSSVRAPSVQYISDQFGSSSALKFSH
jgi:hypothetical protein